MRGKRRRNGFESLRPYSALATMLPCHFTRDEYRAVLRGPRRRNHTAPVQCLQGARRLLLEHAERSRRRTDVRCPRMWAWHEREEIPLHHPSTGSGKPWREAKDLPGATSMKHLVDCFDSIDWWRLRPEQDLLVEQPGAEDPNLWVAAPRAEDGDLRGLCCRPG